jgi:hypothetical protein
MRRASRITAGIALALSIVTARVLISSRSEWRQAEELAKTPPTQGSQEARIRETIEHYGRAARLYTPGNPWARRSLDQLTQTGRHLDEAQQPELALVAWRELRSSVLATRAFYTPNKERLALADERIATLAAHLESPSVDPGADEAARKQWHAARLAQTDEPSVPWTLLALLGFFSWVSCAIGFLWRAVDEKDRLRRKPALIYALGVAAGIALFLLGLARA